MDNGIARGLKIYDARDEKYIDWDELNDTQKEEMTEMYIIDCETFEANAKIMDMYINMQSDVDINTHCLKN